jgi:hypothetical protein
MALIGSITCTTILVIAGVLSALAGYLTVGAYALVFLILLGGGYLLPIGGMTFGTAAVLLARQARDRWFATIATIASAGLSGLLYALGTHFLRE